MNDDLAALCEDALRETLGWPGRMIAASKTSYRNAHPDHVAVFNANVCLRGRKIWHGDLDLTLDERLLAALAGRIGETVYVLHERDGRFENEQQPQLDEAVYSVLCGHTRFDHRRIERAKDGTLRVRNLRKRRQ